MQTNHFHLTFLTFRPFSNWIADLLIRCEMNCLSNCSSVQTIHEYHFHLVKLLYNAMPTRHIKWMYNWIVHNVSAEYPKGNCCAMRMSNRLYLITAFTHYYLLFYDSDGADSEENSAGIRKSISNAYFSFSGRKKNSFFDREFV